VYYSGTVRPAYNEGARVLLFLEDIAEVGGRGAGQSGDWRSLVGTVLRPLPRADTPDVPFCAATAFRPLLLPMGSRYLSVLEYGTGRDDEIAVAVAQAEDAADATLEVRIEGTGSGKVTGPGIGLTCTSICRRTLEFGSSISLTAVANDHSEFAGWSGACSGVGECVIEARNAQKVSATFDTR